MMEVIEMEFALVHCCKILEANIIFRRVLKMSIF